MNDRGLIDRQLERVLASPFFTRARRSSQLLQFLVESKLTGREQDIKEYTIATVVFGRPDSFDPRIDSVVRVEATRLRDRLHSYYQSATEQDLIEISLPAGHYTPVFRERRAEFQSTATEADASAIAEQPVPDHTRAHQPYSRRWLSAAVAATVFGAAAFAVKGRLFEAQRPRLALLQQVAIPGKVLLSPVLSPDSRRLYYASNRDGSRLRIWSQRLDGSGAEALTSEHWDSFDLDVSPDGKWLAYFSKREGGGAYQKPLSGGPELLIAPFGRSPRFSPDSNMVLFWLDDPHTGFGNVFVRRVSRKPYAEGPRQIAGEFADAHNPQWLPDGRVLICGTLRSNVKDMEHDLWIVPLTDLKPPLKTGILPYLKARDIDLHSRGLKNTSFQFYNGSLIFAGIHQDRTLLYSLNLSSEFQPKGEPVPLYDGPGSQDSPASRGDLLAFTAVRLSVNVWRIPLGKDGRAAADPAPLTDAQPNAVFPEISSDGRRLAYVALTRPAPQIWKKDLLTGVESEIYRAPGISRLSASLDASKAFFRVMDGPPPQAQQIYAIDVQRGGVRKVCANCGAPTSVSPSGDYVVHETGGAVLSLAVINVPTGERREVLRHPHHPVQAGRLSPDGKWIAFELDRGPDGIQLFVAPFRGLEFIAESDWIPVSDPGLSSFEPAWSPDGASIYFLSDRSGSRDLWMQRLQPNKRVFAPAARVYAFDDPRLTPLTYSGLQARYVGLSLSSNEAVLTLSQMASSVSVGRLGR